MRTSLQTSDEHLLVATRLKFSYIIQPSSQEAGGPRFPVHRPFQKDPLPLLFAASATLITLALAFYSVGVWSERVARTLRPWHVAMFWTGFIFDVSGTAAMHFLATRPFDLRDAHTLTGQMALWLMLGHAVWATRVARTGTEEARSGFHRYSLFVWLFWLIPYFGGMYLGMGR